MRRRLTAIIGVAFCAGALTALWAARPWEDPPRDRQTIGDPGRPSSAGSPIEAVGTYGETGEGAADGESASEFDLLDRDLVMPVSGVDPKTLQPTFHSPRGVREHEALDILAPRGTPVVAVENGEIVKLFYSDRGGKTIYQFEPTRRYCYYYAHLDAYARGLAEGQQVMRGQVIGYVGSTGNASPEAPHLHFAIFRLGPERRWWEGTAIDPYPVLARRAADSTR